MFPILSIPIPFDPNIISTGVFVLSWHGFLSVVGAGVAVWMAGRAAVRDKLNKDLVYNTAVWGIVGGIIGARLVHVFDHWDFYSGNPTLIFQVWSGGIGCGEALLVVGLVAPHMVLFPDKMLAN